MNSVWFNQTSADKLLIESVSKILLLGEARGVSSTSVDIAAQYINRLIVKAKKEQVMKDFLKYSLETEIDENMLIKIRDILLKEIE